jgi:hypothetical protein
MNAAWVVLEMFVGAIESEMIHGPDFEEYMERYDVPTPREWAERVQTQGVERILAHGEGTR